MMLLKTAFASLLVLLVGCEQRESPSENAARPPAVPTAEGTPGGAKAPSRAEAQSMAAVDEHVHHEHHAHDQGAQGDGGSADAGAAEAVYACPMHPAVTSSTPGRCPECGMNLVQKK